MEPTKNFVTLPRKIISDVLNGRMSGAEFFAYAWIRGKGNPYGVAQVSIGEIVAVYPHRVSPNHIYKLVRALRTKKYIYYPDRAGRRGAFEVHMGDWLLPDKGGVKTLDRFFNSPVRPVDAPQAVPQSEPPPIQQEVSQAYLELKKRYGSSFKMPPAKE